MGEEMIKLVIVRNRETCNKLFNWGRQLLLIAMLLGVVKKQKRGQITRYKAIFLGSVKNLELLSKDA